MTELIPTERLDIVWPEGVERNTDAAADYALGQIMAKAAELRAAGQRSWFEVRYPIPEHEGDDRTLEQKLADREATYDAIEVFEDGSIKTLLPYAWLKLGVSES
jgi:hypothetical protein